MWYVRNIDNNFAVMFQSYSYDKAYRWLMDHPPAPGCGHELIWIDSVRMEKSSEKVA
jgi:hypothetical protein